MISTVYSVTGAGMGGRKILRSGFVSRVDAWGVSIEIHSSRGVDALEGEFLQVQRNFINWRLVCPHTLSLVYPCVTL